jgi:hypothetical protein
LPEEIGEKVEVTNLGDYLAARGIARYSFEKTEGEEADVNAFNVPEASVFAAGAIGGNYGGFFEFERVSDGTVDLVAQVVRVWGKETSFGGARAGTGHTLVGGAVAGFDRATGIFTPMPLDEPTTEAIPFSFAGDQVGGAGRKLRPPSLSPRQGRGSAIRLAHEEAFTASTKKDWAVENQLMRDAAGSGLTLIAYRGTIEGLNPKAPDLDSHFWRLSASANKIVGNFELLGGYVGSKDEDLPIGEGSPFLTDEVTGDAFWVSGQYIHPHDAADRVRPVRVTRPRS